MKRALIFLILIYLSAFTFAEKALISDTFDFQGEWVVNSGEWSVSNGKLLQLDEKETIATISRIVRQRGVLLYSFDVQYLAGLEDGYGGFGIHISVDKPTGLRSWGQNDSFLLWITFDEEAYGDRDFYAQAYKSTSTIYMNFHGMEGDEYRLAESNLSIDRFLSTAETGDPLQILLSLDTNTGKGRIQSPVDQRTYYKIDLKTPVGEGMYIALRTNSIALAFDNVSVTRLDWP